MRRRAAPRGSPEGQCAPTRHMTVQSHFAWDTWSIRRKRLAKEGLCSRNSTVAAEQEIDGLALLVDGAIKIVPLGFDRDVGFVYSPRGADRFGEPVPAFLELRHVPSYPSKNRGMGNLDSTVGHHLRQVPIRQPIGD